MDENVGDQPGSQLISGAAANSIHAVVGHESLTSPLIGAAFWQAYLTYVRSTRDAPWAPLLDHPAANFIVIRHGSGWPKQNLLILDPTRRDAMPGVYDARVSPGTLSHAWGAFVAEIRNRWLYSGLQALLTDPIASAMFRFGGEAAAQAAVQVLFQIVIVPFPEIEHTSLSSSAIPVSPLEIRAIEPATAGVIAEDRSGRSGVTTVHHAFDSSLRRSILGETASVGNAKGIVVSNDYISDSCFIEVDTSHIPDLRVDGPLIGKLPAMYDHCEFKGAVSGRSKTAYVGQTQELPWWYPGVQSRIFTKADTVPGDSGAALVDLHGSVLGFAKDRSAAAAHLQQSGWIWAQAVYHAHELKLR
jgi:hypothetical protein